MELIRIAVVEDDDSYVEVLRQMFARRPGMELVGAYPRAIKFLSDLPNFECDIVLLDINLPRMSGLECIAQIREFSPATRIIMLTVHDEDEYILQAFLSGADGYLLKESKPKQIEEAIRDALNGGAPMSAAVARKVVRLLNKLQKEDKSKRNQAVISEIEKLLSKREFEVLEWLAEGKTYDEIAGGLYVSKETVKSHIRQVYRKLQVRNKAEAISRLL